MKIFCFLITISVLIKLHHGANILVLSGIPSPSHFIFNKALTEGLAARGHNLTVVSPDVDKKIRPNIHYIHLEGVYPHYYEGAVHIDLLEMSRESTLNAVFSFYDFNDYMCEGIGLSKGLNVIRNYPKNFKFDLVLHDYTCGPCLLGLLPQFKYPPLIGISAFNNPPYTVEIVGGDKLGLTTKPFYLLYYDVNMNFFERIHNGLINFIDSMYRKYFAIPRCDKKMREIFGENIPYAHDLDSMTALMLVNSNPAVDYPESLPPNIIQVGGMQIKDSKPVPKDIEDFINKGKKGAVLMALGTNIRSDDLGEEKIDIILEAFRQIPEYNFLWKFETSEKVKKLPVNVKISDWLPQNDILAHPKLMLFITHSGLLSTHETTWWGKPIVGIPFIADQHRNMHKSVTAGVGVKVDFHTITTEKLKAAINEVLKNPKYRRNMEIRSKRFRDQPEKPLERAIWWSEFILRNPKPTHLRPAEFNLGLLGSHFWDIQVLILVAILLIVLSVSRILKKMFRKRPGNLKEKKNN